MTKESLIIGNKLLSAIDAKQRDINSVDGLNTNFNGHFNVSVNVNDTATVRSILSMLKSCLVTEKKLLEDEFKAL